ncbi:hypothetical protein DYBT9275_05243 [Dyadobacter sp. CECT 9275]|uniref:Acyltransferase 3 domain-containing protein n=1 Tax=Dyadobacter helix TaxID=2822344 RepID=A0A916JJ64_9BACT|nr:acyltransferase [Dyadobacter sp. CECT 9275]CAG5012766.1 hypothetical protein DYBT9275_05243 [Dyadobacter sp. CECT 9275]
MKNSAMIPERLLELDALRGLAAFGVMLFHFTFNKKTINPSLEFRYGVSGVDLFFMISGFVIFMSITKIKNRSEFIISRFSRLYPTFWACIIITSSFIFVFENENFNLPQIFFNLSMFPAFFSVEDLDPSYWTLVVELTFYAWIFAVYMIRKTGEIETIGLITLVIILLFHQGRHFYPELYRFVQLKIQLINHFPLFLSGILFYQLKFKGDTFTRYLFLLFCFLSACYLHDKGGRTMYIIGFGPHCSLMLFYHFIFILFINKKLKFLSQPSLLFLGNISYSLYLLHQYVGKIIMDLALLYFSPNIYLAIAIAIIFCILIAHLVTRFFERPAVTFIRSLNNKYQPANPAAAY